jgi:hypothetical protein
LDWPLPPGPSLIRNLVVGYRVNSRWEVSGKFVCRPVGPQREF